MKKIESVAALQNLKDSCRRELSLGKAGTFEDQPVLIRVAMATCGIASGAREVMEFLSIELEKRSIPAVVTQTGCMGYCYAEPTVQVTKPGQAPLVFGFVNARKADEIIEKYIKNNEIIESVIPQNYETIDQPEG